MEFALNPDRERMDLTLLMGLLVNGGDFGHHSEFCYWDFLFF